MKQIDGRADVMKHGWQAAIRAKAGFKGTDVERIRLTEMEAAERAA